MARKKTNIAGVSTNLSESISKDIAVKIKRHLPLEDRKIGISVSESEEFLELGFSKIHQKDITIEITRHLLVNGAHLVYGGDLRQDGYTYAFSELAFQYRSIDHASKMHFTNYFPWPIHLALENSGDATFKRNRVNVVKVASSSEVPEEFKKANISPNTLDNRYYWAKSMTKMRKEMIANSEARIFIGGKLSNYKGFYPGILEEAFFSIGLKQPIYLVGAFGGAASFIIRALKGDSLSLLEEEILQWSPSLKDLLDFCSERNDKIVDIKTVLTKFQKMGLSGLSRINKLTIEQNEILFESKYFNEMIMYILLGLKKSLKA